MPPVPKPPSDKSGRNRNLIIALAVAAVVAVALIAGSVLLTRGNSDKTSASTETTVATTGTSTDSSTPAPVALVAGIPQHGTILGKPGATVRMLQFEDLQCPICKQYTDNAFSSIVNEYVRTGRIKIDFRGLAFLGPDSLKALKIAVAAGFQNRLWQVVGLFYDNQGPENSGLGNRLADRRDPGRGSGPRCGPGQEGREQRRRCESDHCGREAGDQPEGPGNALVLHRRRRQQALPDPARGLRAERVPAGPRRRPQGMTARASRIGALLAAVGLCLGIATGVGASTGSAGTGR